MNMRSDTEIAAEAEGEAEAAEASQRRLAADRAVDSVLADSFPASDPPSWTLGIAPPRPATAADPKTPRI
jgi:hypothetical protein